MLAHILPHVLHLQPSEVLVQIGVILLVDLVLDGCPVLPVIIVECFECSLEEAVVILAYVDGLGVEIVRVLLHPMHLLEVALDDLVWMVAGNWLLWLWLRRHLHSHRLLGADSAVRVLLLEDIPVDPVPDDERARLDDVFRQPTSIRLKYGDRVADLMVLFLGDVLGLVKGGQNIEFTYAFAKIKALLDLMQYVAVKEKFPNSKNPE